MFGVEIVSHDTRKYRFQLPSPEHVLGLPVGKLQTVRLLANSSHTKTGGAKMAANMDSLTPQQRF